MVLPATLEHVSVQPAERTVFTSNGTVVPGRGDHLQLSIAEFVGHSPPPREI